MKSDSILAIDIGPITTRAALFDVLGDRYALLGVGSADTTLEAPFRNLRRGLRFALEELQAITGRILMDGHKTIIRPVNRNGLGVDQCVATVSAGPPIKMVAIGLMESESLAITSRLLETTLAGNIHTIGMRERRNPAAVVDELLQFKPDLFVIAGGTERGAEGAIVKLLEPVVVAYRLMSKDRRPAIIYAGNHILDARIRSLFGETSGLTFAPNVQPDFDHQFLDGARVQIIRSVRAVFNKNLPGFTDLDRWTLGQILPTEAAFKRMIQYLSKNSQNNKGVVGIFNSARVVQVAGFFPQGETHRVSMRPDWICELDQLNDRLTESEVMPWVADADASHGLVMQEFLHQALNPASLPLFNQSQAIEAAITHALLREQVKSAFRQLPQAGLFENPLDYSLIEPIIACGDLVDRSPSPAHTAILLLDCIQPVGITTLVIDNRQILPMLGAIADIEPLVTVQMFDSPAFQHLATVITPLGSAPQGTPVLRVRMIYDDGREATLDIKQGNLELIPLTAGQSAQIQLIPFYRYDVGMGGAGRGGTIKANGSQLGVIIDARGRPLTTLDEPYQREEVLKKWIWTLGG